MVMPQFLNSEDEECGEAVLDKAGLLNCKSAIINPVNFSNRALSREALCAISDLLDRHGFKVAFVPVQGLRRSTKPLLRGALLIVREI